MDIVVASVSALAISVLIISTLRLSAFEAITFRLSKEQYDWLYNWVLLSIIVGLFCFVASLCLRFYEFRWLFILATVLLGLQIAILVIPTIIMLLPFKNSRKGKTPIDNTPIHDRVLEEISESMREIAKSSAELTRLAAKTAPVNRSDDPK